MVKDNEKRKEVHLRDVIIKLLAKQAKAQKRTLKNYMEFILTETAMIGGIDEFKKK
jgi:hypothetical protein